MHQFELTMLLTPEYWQGIGQLIPVAIGETLIMVAISTVIAYIIGVPLGVLLVVTSPGHIMPHPWVEKVLGTIINLFRSVPFIILMVALVPLTVLIVNTQIGIKAAIVPLVVSAAPFVARMVETSLREVPYGVIEAALSMGASPWQIIRKVLLPEAKSSLILGVAITTINVVGYTAMAGAVGGGGLGDVGIQYGYYRYRADIMFITVVFLVIIVQVVQSLGNYLARRLTHHN